MAGRPPTPESVKHIAGTIRPDRVRENVPVPPPGDLIKPKALKGRGSKIWDEWAPRLIAMGTLTWVDSYIFAEWCQLSAQWEKEGDDMQAALRTIWGSRHTQLGIGAVNRAKAGTKKKGKKDEASQFFEDTA